MVEETGVLEKTTDLSQVTDKLLSHNVVSSTPRLSGMMRIVAFRLGFMVFNATLNNISVIS